MKIAYTVSGQDAVVAALILANYLDDFAVEYLRGHKEELRRIELEIAKPGGIVTTKFYGEFKIYALLSEEWGTALRDALAESGVAEDPA
jgi:hypothetical protein